MKHISKIIPFTIILLAALSCGKDDPAGQNGQKVILDWPGYIWFESGVKTKTEQIESMGGRTFNVIAFKYGSDWATFKATGTPSSAMGTNGFKFPTPVICASDGACTYTSSNNSTPVEWEGNMKYSFFAYYPALSADDPASTVSLTTTNTTAGVPMLKYTVPAPVGGYMNASQVPDIITANIIDAQNTGAGAVDLQFSHRLCMFCVEARNLKKETARISDLVLTITSDRYSSVTIPLDGSALRPGSIVNSDFVCRMQPAGSEEVSVGQYGKDGSSANTLVSHPDCHIAFIPQDPGIIKSNLSGKLSFKWNGVETEAPFTATNAFQEGRMYAFVITVAADDAISVDVREMYEWIEKSNDIIFE